MNLFLEEKILSGHWVEPPPQEPVWSPPWSNHYRSVSVLETTLSINFLPSLLQTISFNCHWWNVFNVWINKLFGISFCHWQKYVLSNGWHWYWCWMFKDQQWSDWYGGATGRGTRARPARHGGAGLGQHADWLSVVPIICYQLTYAATMLHLYM